MRRTIYRNRFLVDEILLNNTELTKISEILLHHSVLGDEGIVNGLNVSASTFTNGAVDVTSGIAVLPNREVVNLPIDQLSIQLANEANGEFNIITISYSESLSEPKVGKNGGADHLVFVDISPEIRVYSVLDFAILSSERLQNELVIAIAVGGGAGLPLSDIYTAESDINILNFPGLEILKGVIIKSTTVLSTPKEGSIRFDIQTGFLSFISPNNPSPPPLTIGGLSVFPVDRSLREPVIATLIDPGSPNTDSIEVEIFGSTLVKSLSSFNSNQLENLQNEGRINGNYINEVLDFRGLYSQNSTEIQDGIVRETKRASAIDRRHREKLGTGLTTDENPHGLSLADITELFETIPGNFRIGDDLLDTPEEAEYPRLSARVDDKSKYTLLLESDLPNEGSRAVSPARIYVSRLGFCITVNAKFNPLDNTWTKDNVAFSTVPAIKVEMTTNGFDISYNTNSASFLDSTGWTQKVLTTNEQTVLRESLILVPKTNEEHNDSSNTFTGLINEGDEGPVDVKTLLYEDKNGPEGGLRIYMGRDYSRSGGDNTLEFTYNAKNSEASPSLWWTDDNTAASYVFRFVFNSNLSGLETMQSLVHDFFGVSFSDSALTENTFNIPGGFKTVQEDEEFITGITVATNGSILYENAQTRTKIVSLSDVGYLTSTYPVENFENVVGYMDRDQGNLQEGIMDYGLPVIIQIENLDKNLQRIDSPRLMWRGPQRPVLRTNQRSQFGFIGTKRYPDAPNTEITFVYPIYFEEDNVEIQSMALPFDWLRFPVFGQQFNEILYNRQEFEFGEDFDAVNRWLKFDFVAVNYVNDNVRNVNPGSFSNSPIIWDSVDGGTSADAVKAIKFSNPEGGTLFSFGNSFLGQDEFLQLRVSTNKASEFIDVDYPIVEYRPLMIGHLIINYTTFNIE